jgi:hypothetical protein
MRVDSRHLKPHTVDAKARHYAGHLAEGWRAAGLAVDLVEYLATSTEPGGYVLTARSQTSVMSCRCQAWLHRRWPWGGRQLWTIAVTVRASVPDGEISGPVQPPQLAGVAAGWDHEQAWQMVLDWIDGASPLPATLREALAGLR